MGIHYPELPKTTRQWVLRKRPKAGLVTSEHMEFKTNVPIFESTTEGKILVKATYFSNDPAQITWIKDDGVRSYAPSIGIGHPILSGSVGEVLASWVPDFKPGDIVFGYFTWSDYCLVDCAFASILAPILKVPQQMDPADYIASNLTALTAYIGLLITARATSKDRTVVVTGAAGAIGTIVAQIAKNVLKIPNVVGITGSEAKCDYLVNELGLDAAVNYNSPNYFEELKKATPGFIDIFFDGVGGSNLNLICKHINQFGRIVAIGGMSNYASADNPPVIGSDGYMQLVYQNASILGFIANSHVEEFPKAIEDITRWINEGKIKLVKTTIERSLEDVPDGLQMLLRGENVGKLVTRLKLDTKELEYRL